jgi:hypothetical protein
MQRAAFLLFLFSLILGCQDRKVPSNRPPSQIAMPVLTYQRTMTADAGQHTDAAKPTGPALAEKGTDNRALQEMLIDPITPLAKLSDLKPDMLRRDVTKLLGASKKPTYDERHHCTPLHENDDLRSVSRLDYVSLGSEERRLVPKFENDRLVEVDVVAIDDSKQPLTLQSDTQGWWTGKFQLSIIDFSCTVYRLGAERLTHVSIVRLTPTRPTVADSLSCNDLISLGPSLLGKTLTQAVASNLRLTIEDHESFSDVEQMPYQQGAKVLADQKCKLEAMTYGKPTIRTLLIVNSADEQAQTDFYQQMIKLWGQPRVRPDTRGVLMLQFTQSSFLVEAYRADRWMLIIKFRKTN